jgi:hypothetical protein
LREDLGGAYQPWPIIRFPVTIDLLAASFNVVGKFKSFTKAIIPLAKANPRSLPLIFLISSAI